MEFTCPVCKGFDEREAIHPYEWFPDAASNWVKVIEHQFNSLMTPSECGHCGVVSSTIPVAHRARALVDVTERIGPHSFGKAAQGLGLLVTKRSVKTVYDTSEEVAAYHPNSGKYYVKVDTEQGVVV